MRETDDLEEGLAGLAELLLAAQPHEDALRQVAQFAARAVPGADGTSVCMVGGELPETRVASHAFVRAVDEAQYRVGQGPCVDALRTGQAVVAPSLAADPRYPQFGREAVDMGV